MSHSTVRQSRPKPYQRNRRRRSIINREAEEFNELQPEVAENVFENIVKKTWRLHTLTPLYEFKHGDVKKYSNALSAYIDALKNKGFGFLVSNTHTWTSVFSVLNGLRYSPENLEAIQITVSVKTKGVVKEIFTGILSCCLSGSLPRILRHEKLTAFPVFMTRGPETIRRIIVAFLQETFDCCVCPQLIKAGELEWIFALWPVADNGRGQQIPSELMFSLPSKNMRSVRFSMDKDSLAILWNKVRDMDSDNLTITEMKSFMRQWENHFVNTIGINPASFKLTEVSTPVLIVNSRGKLKIRRTEYVLRVLQHMAELSLQVFGLTD